MQWIWMQCGKVCATEEGKTPQRLCGGGWRNAVYANQAVLHAEELALLGLGGAATPLPPSPLSKRAGGGGGGGGGGRGAVASRETKVRAGERRRRAHNDEYARLQ